MIAKNWTVPDHVPKELVRDFDIWNPPGYETDYHLALKKAHECPDIYWYPGRGVGHWVATRGEDLQVLFKDYEHLAATPRAIPKEDDMPFRFLPIQADPPEHTFYRGLINPWFTPKAVGDLEGNARKVTIDLIEGFRKKGECEFITEFSQHLPIAIFLKLVDLPWEDRDYLFSLAEPHVYEVDDHAAKEKSFHLMMEYMGKKLAARRAKPGPDMLTKIALATTPEGQPIEEPVRLGMAALILIGGLDTVASTLGFIAHFLAGHPAHRQELAAHPELIASNAVEEFLRRLGVANPSRTIPRDYVYKGIHFKAGDQMVLAAPLHGMDERKFENAMEVNFHRPQAIHSTFGHGVHRCPGSYLARTEIKVFLEEWTKRIPDFSIKPGAKLGIRAGINGSFVHLPLVWDAK